MRKLDAARRQLGTALALFIADLDPVSVHCLACGGAELAQHLAKTAGGSAFFEHALATNPGLDQRSLSYLRNKYWNAFKHATTTDGRERADDILLADFSDEQNDHQLLIGWLDLSEAMGSMPIEAQVFQAWYFAMHPDKLTPAFSADVILSVFPKLSSLDRVERKRELRRVIDVARNDEDVMSDPQTETRPLILA